MDDKFLKLAKKMGMNTEIRKKIFHILVTSEVFFSILIFFIKKTKQKNNNNKC